MLFLCNVCFFFFFLDFFFSCISSYFRRNKDFSQIALSVLKMLYMLIKCHFFLQGTVVVHPRTGLDASRVIFLNNRDGGAVTMPHSCLCSIEGKSSDLDLCISDLNISDLKM